MHTVSDIRYDKLVESALRSVIRNALTQVEHDGGLPGDHHFYITFETNFEGVEIPEYLKSQYQNEMTIVLQYQFLGLRVEEDLFGVTLSFSGKHERLVVPYAAITTFADPAVNFALQFQVMGQESEEDSDNPAPLPKDTPKDERGVPEGEMGKIISLDSFRKKPQQ